MVNAASDALRDELQQLIREREQEGVRGLAERVGPADWADLIPQLDPNEVAVLLQWLPDEEIPEIFEELDPSIAASILRTLSANEAAVVLGGMDPDDAADVVENLPDADVDEILVRMRAEDATQIRALANYDPDTAGGLMTPEYVAVSREARASEAIAAIRSLVDQAETVSYVYVVDAERHLLGVLSLYRLMLSAAAAASRSSCRTASRAWRSCSASGLAGSCSCSSRRPIREPFCATSRTSSRRSSPSAFSSRS